ncbi:sigma factor [Kitasatospora sp. NPDC001527]|uniref:sigma factor n=1 Tax=Kitasatospora sp. NPDC001527 TaxID=3154519 RepID=UPI00332B6A4D
MLNVTEIQISAAKENDLDAIAAIVRATEGIVAEAASRHSKFAGSEDRTRAEDLAQEGRVAVWRAVSRFEGSTADQFAAYIRQTVEGAVTQARRAETWCGVTSRAAKDFELALRHAGGDPYAAERLAVLVDPMGDRKMSPDQARACRLAWQGLEYLDAPVATDGEGGPVTLGMVLAEELGMSSDLVTPSDRAAHRQEVIRGQVHRALGLLSDRMRHVLKADHGIAPVPQYGADVPDDVLATDMGLTPAQIQRARYCGQNRFSSLYLAGAHQW